MRIAHVRKHVVKVGGNPFYRSELLSGPVATLCGAPVTNLDLPVRWVYRKTFDRKNHEAICEVTICERCLELAKGGKK